jgi:hypothetical protein
MTVPRYIEDAHWAFSTFVAKSVHIILNRLCILHDIQAPAEANILPIATVAYPHMRGHIVNIFFSRDLTSQEQVYITGPNHTICIDGQHLGIHIGHLNEDGTARDAPTQLQYSTHINNTTMHNIMMQVYHNIARRAIAARGVQIAPDIWRKQSATTTRHQLHIPLGTDVGPAFRRGSSRLKIPPVSPTQAPIQETYRSPFGQQLKGKYH